MDSTLKYYWQKGVGLLKNEPVTLVENIAGISLVAALAVCAVDLWGVIIFDRWVPILERLEHLF